MKSNTAQNCAVINFFSIEPDETFKLVIFEKEKKEKKKRKEGRNKERKRKS